MGAAVLSLEGYEADDILGTLAAMAEQNDVITYIATGDKDSLQLISDKTNVILATNTEPILFDTKKFEEKYGISPSQFVDVKALMGTVQTIFPGCPGLAKKPRSSLLQNTEVWMLFMKIWKKSRFPRV